MLPPRLLQLYGTDVINTHPPYPNHQTLPTYTGRLDGLASGWAGGWVGESNTTPTTNNTTSKNSNHDSINYKQISAQRLGRMSKYSCSLKDNISL